jgi:hypothetical protein
VVLVIFFNLDSMIFPKNVELFSSDAHLNPYDTFVVHNTLIGNGHQFASSPILFSHGSVKLIVQKAREFCNCAVSQSKKLKDISFDDVLMSCLQMLDIKLVRDMHILQSDPVIYPSWSRTPCERPLSITNVHRSTVNLLCPDNNCVEGATYADIQGHSSLKTQDFVRTTFESKVTASAGPHDCEEKCDNEERCMSWTYHDGKCYVNFAIPESQVVSGATSKICMARYSCHQKGAGPCNYATATSGTKFVEQAPKDDVPKIQRPFRKWGRE